MKTLTHEQAVALFHYNQETGEVFSRRLGRRIGYPIENGRYRIIHTVDMPRREYEHRLVWFLMTGRWPVEIDHVNGDPCDNRWCNLREASRRENARNRGKQRNNPHGYKGVTVRTDCPSKPFCAAINVGGKRKHLGYFSTAEEAHQAYWEAAQKYHGDFARK